MPFKLPAYRDINWGDLSEKLEEKKNKVFKMKNFKVSNKRFCLCKLSEILYSDEHNWKTEIKDCTDQLASFDNRWFVKI